MSDYDSSADTLRHIIRVRDFLGEFAVALLNRGKVHDASKLQPPEKEAFDRETPKLKSLEYGSSEYKESIARLGPALQHHYQCNLHHPEHYPCGVSDMDLLDLVEMYCDWCAAVERTKDGGLLDSLAYNKARFNLDPQVYSILVNTAMRHPLPPQREE